MDNFNVSVDSAQGRATVRPAGELDLASAPTLWSALAELVTGGHRAVVMDLSRVTFSDCAGLRPVRRAMRQARGLGTVIELRDPAPAVRRVLDLTGLGAPAVLA